MVIILNEERGQEEGELIIETINNLKTRLILKPIIKEGQINKNFKLDLRMSFEIEIGKGEEKKLCIN